MWSRFARLFAKHPTAKLMAQSKYVILIIVGCISVSCNRLEDDRYAPAYRFFDTSLITFLSVDTEVVDLYPEDFDTLTIKGTETVYFGYGNQMAILNGYLFHVSNNRTAVIRYDFDKKNVSGLFSYVGRGPGEYQLIYDLITCGKYLYVLDANSSKLIKYDYDLNFLREFHLDGAVLGINIGLAIVNNTILYTTTKDEEYLIKTMSKVDMKKATKNFHHRIISLGKSTTFYNQLHITPNGLGEFAVVSTNIPIVHIYNEDFEVESVMRLRGAHLEEVSTTTTEPGIILNPPPIDIETDQTVKLDGFSFIDAQFSENQLFLYFSNRYSFQRYLIVLEKNNDQWRHKGSYRFYKNSNDLFTVFNIHFNSPFLYLSSPFEGDIIRVNINKLQ